MNDKAKRSSRRPYIIAFTAAMILLAVFFGLRYYQVDQVAPVCEVSISGVQAGTPDEVQAACRADHERFAGISDEYENVCWVWCGDDKLYLVKSNVLKVETEDVNGNFTAVRFYNDGGQLRHGYIIDPVSAPNELGRIDLSEADEYTFDSVSMSIRVGLRRGDLSFENAVYLWEKGSSEVFAVKEGSYTPVEGNIVSFTDDGGMDHTCYILDTEI